MYVASHLYYFILCLLVSISWRLNLGDSSTSEHTAGGWGPMLVGHDTSAISGCLHITCWLIFKSHVSKAWSLLNTMSTTQMTTVALLDHKVKLFIMTVSLTLLVMCAIIMIALYCGVCFAYPSLERLSDVELTSLNSRLTVTLPVRPEPVVYGHGLASPLGSSERFD